MHSIRGRARHSAQGHGRCDLVAEITRRNFNMYFTAVYTTLRRVCYIVSHLCGIVQLYEVPAAEARWGAFDNRLHITGRR